MIEELSLVGIPQQDEVLRLPVRECAREYVRSMPADERARSWMGFDAGFSKLLGQRGWLGLTLPTAYGGQGRGHFARFVVAEELLAAGAPVAAHWIADRQSGPLIARYGTEQQKQFYLPRICAGDAFFCIGMSEPNAGSDLAGIGTRAEKRPGGWTLQGQKIWTTHASRSHYMIALVRTSGTASDRHRGLSQVIVDLSLPGVTVRPIRDLTGDAHFCEVFFDGIRLDEEALIGTEGAGWEQVNAELAFERSGPERLYSSMVLLEQWLDALRGKGGADQQPRELDPADLALAGRLMSHLVTLRQMSLSVAHRLARGESPMVDASIVKDLGTEFEQAIPALLADSLNTSGRPPDELLVRTVTYLTQVAPTFSLRGGTREILRGIIARGLGLR